MKEMIDFIFEPPTPTSKRRRLQLSPRGSFKSTIIVGYCVHRIAMDRNVRILYASETHANSAKYVSQVRQLLESARVEEAYGSFSQRQSWGSESFTVTGRTKVRKEPTMDSAGVSETKTGMHYDLIIVDDCVSFQNSQTKQQLEKTREWYQFLLSILEPDGLILVNGTRYDDGDLYGWILEDRQASFYDTLILDCYRDDGSACFKHLDGAFLEQQAKEQGDYIFSCQYRNQPVPKSLALFHQGQFQVIRPYAYENINMNKYLLTDTAVGTNETNDYSVLVVIGLDSLDNAYVLDVQIGRWKPDEFVSRFIAMTVKHGVLAASLERIPMNFVFSEMIQSELRNRQIRLRLVEITGRARESKYMRVQGLQPAFAAGKLYWSTELDPALLSYEAGSGKVTGEIADQLLRFPRYPHDDIPDALSDIYRRGKEGARLFPAPQQTPVWQDLKPLMVSNGRYQGPPEPMESKAPIGGDFFGWAATRVAR